MFMASTGTCGSCGASPTVLKVCSRCKQQKYCNVDCQEQDWSAHKQTCRKPDVDHKKTCVICKKPGPEEVYPSPCGHWYHFSCQSNKGDVFRCPDCGAWWGSRKALGNTPWYQTDTGDALVHVLSFLYQSRAVAETGNDASLEEEQAFLRGLLAPVNSKAEQRATEELAKAQTAVRSAVEDVKGDGAPVESLATDERMVTAFSNLINVFTCIFTAEQQDTYSKQFCEWLSGLGFMLPSKERFAMLCECSRMCGFQHE